jgi:hypothetical protein
MPGLSVGISLILTIHTADSEPLHCRSRWRHAGPSCSLSWGMVLLFAALGLRWAG